MTDAAAIADESSSAVPSLDDAEYRAAVLDVLGLLASGELASFARLAEDAPHAPDLVDRLTISRMAAGELAHIDALESYVSSLGGDLPALMERYRDVLSDFDARTVPRDWWERLIKTYIGYSLVLDFQREVAGHLDPATRAVVDEVLADSGHGDYVVGALGPVIAAEPQIGARLALWGRRIVGEGLGVASQVLAQHPDLVKLAGQALAGGPGAMLNRLSGEHARRMGRLGLTA
ncbi:conserved hypothetical protein [Beutenbergia cavernae DSM 12333]|uniref:Ferritin-like domain-containing protein n=1 Tax=Beutenbergia cavernae (strain ATCC BAA-8 / DSM 12333 / CCUG 43141 / JCM 11478 / NBRC 16432 / NCIMB 13614 / HKI 0122) TaxID=471853 RepID=C5BZ35_BEUC1|nr:ferritin-like fold-containing protein [Beutenbergia cavernae]ACQ81150.1 conserved hypothetical protein [Beutenbergia cavernae DSM 12333]